MDDNLLTIVFGFKNRDLLRVARCLDSLSNQTYKGFKVIFVDYGSERDLSKKASALIESFKFCKYVYSETRGWPWNRSRALNIGIRLAQTKYVMTSDIDLIFDPEFISLAMKEADENSALHSTCYYLPKHFRKWSKISSLTHSFKQSLPNALGLMLLLAKENYEKIGGFDEFYQFWGAEDRDIEHRLNMSGVKTKWLNSSEAILYHQWHPVNNNHTFSFLPVGFWEDVEMHFGKHYANPDRNSIEGWGVVTERNERPALDLMEKTSTATHTYSSSKKSTAADIGRDIAKLFYGLKAGESLCLVSGFSHPQQMILYIVNLLNRASGMLGIGYQLLPERDQLKDAFWLFYRNNKADTTDYAITTDEKYYYLIRK